MNNLTCLTVVSSQAARGGDGPAARPADGDSQVAIVGKQAAKASARFG